MITGLVIGLVIGAIVSVFVYRNNKAIVDKYAGKIDELKDKVDTIIEEKTK